MMDYKKPFWWVTQESEDMLKRGYLLPNQTIEEKVRIKAKYASELLKRPDLEQPFFDMIALGWTSLSSPIWANFGESRGLPISCFSSYVPDSISGIFSALHEVAIMTQKGGGTSGYFDLRAKGASIKGGGKSSGLVSFVEPFDSTIKNVSQAGVRRGGFAAYVDIDHPELLDFLRIKDKDSIMQSINTAVNVTDDFMEKMIAGDQDRRTIWAEILKNRREKGIPYIHFIDTVNRNAPEVYKDKGLKINQSNLCVSGDTKLLTKDGYIDIEKLENKEVSVWNGEEWSEVTVLKTGQDQKLLLVTTDSGHEIKATPYHRWYIQKELEVIQKTTMELESGDKIIKFETPVIEGSNSLENIYTEGFLSFVPLENYTIKSRIEWLESLVTSSGFLEDSDGSKTLQIPYTDKDFLRKVQLMLQTLGCDSKVEGYRLLINNNSIHKLLSLGFKNYKIKPDLINPNTDSYDFISVDSVEVLKGTFDTFCANEPKKHKLIFNGVITGNCNEIELHTSEDESLVCCLSSLNLATYHEWKNSNVVELLTYFLDAVLTDFIDKTANDKGMGRARRFADNQRAIGIGVMGLHSFLQQEMTPFDSPLAVVWNKKIFKQISEQSLKASQKLAMEYGEPELLKGYGRRNATLMAVAPTTSSAAILGQVSPGIEPYKSNYFVVGLSKGSFARVSVELGKLLEKYGQNKPEVWNNIKLNKGSVQQLDFLTQEEKDVFKTFEEISPLNVIKMASIRQKYIDQSQSLNLMIPNTMSIKDINAIHIEAWKSGVKGLYYQRGTSVSKETLLKMQNCSSCEG